jgi:hypothetical protein
VADDSEVGIGGDKPVPFVGVLCAVGKHDKVSPGEPSSQQAQREDDQMYRQTVLSLPFPRSFHIPAQRCVGDLGKDEHGQYPCPFTQAGLRGDGDHQPRMAQSEGGALSFSEQIAVALP